MPLNTTPIILEGTSHWAFINKPDENGKYSIQLSNLKDEDLEALKKLGIPIKNKDKANAEKNALDGKNRPTDIGDFISAKSKFIPALADKDGNEIAPEDRKDVFSGSTVKIIVVPYETKFMGKKHIGLGLKAVQIVKLSNSESGGGLLRLFGGNKNTPEEDLNDNGTPF